MDNKLNNLNVNKIDALPSPDEVKKSIPISEKAKQTVIESRRVISNLISEKSNLPLLIVGPCSIHDTDAALEFAKRLVKLREDLIDKCYIIMRVYFEKPRTTLGWKGLINDPNMDKSFEVEKGINLARNVLNSILELGLPTATEMLDPIVPQYIGDLVCWASLGARTTESQPHREMASGLSMPVGFKNATNGDPTGAINGMKVANNPHSFFGTNSEGKISIVNTNGNKNVHLILRGGSDSPNFTPITIKECVQTLKKQNLSTKILIDCSHGNSKKKHVNQPLVFNNIMFQRQSNLDHILGVMLESNIHEGNQNIPDNLSELSYGVSVTDECMSWETTESLIRSTFN
jgi:3-deoxy-7-phosphoheptulonate synthase